MKKLFLLLMMFFGVVASGLAQTDTCMPNPEGIPDTAFGVYPLPYIADIRPDGGLTDTACLNRDFEFTFTIKVGDTLTLSGQTAPVNSVSFAADGTAITYEPLNGAAALEGFSYVCNPPNCVFTSDTLGCVKIFGTVTSESQIGQHNIKIAGQVSLNLFGNPFAVDVEFPTDAAPELAGNYYLFVQDPSSPYCMGTSNTYGAYVPDIELSNRPNPFSEFTQIHIFSREQGDFDLRVFDMLGKVVQSKRINLHRGENIIDFDGRDLPDGMYVYTISNERGGLSDRMVVNHGRR